MVLTKVQLVKWIEDLAAIFKENKEYLTELDAAIGDADHGVNMVRGFCKVIEKLPEVTSNDIGSILKTTGMTLLSSVGGASGPLYGTFFLRGGMAAASKLELTRDDVLELFQAGVEGIVQRGRPEVGDKTMYDVWVPVLFF